MTLWWFALVTLNPTGAAGALVAGRVVVANGGPSAVRRLLPVDPGWGALGPPVTAACLDLGVTRVPDPGYVLSLDEPVYATVQAPPARQAPAGGAVVAGVKFNGGELDNQFANPPDAARPWVWAHWLNSNVTKPSITAQLESIKRVGLGGITMIDVNQPGIPPGPHNYLDAGWQELYAYEIAEATRLGLEVMSGDGAGYCANGGPWITPELAAQKIVESTVRVPGGRKFSGKLPLPAANGNFYRDVAVLAINETATQANYTIAGLDLKRLTWTNYIKYTGTRSAPLDATAPGEVCISPANIVNLTGQMKADGALNWAVPAGTWTILRFGHTWTGQNTLPAPPGGLGPECDKLDKHGIQAHFNHAMQTMLTLAGPAAGKTFHTFFVDSWEAGGQNWTERMAEEFRRRRGYDLIPFLPVMTGRVVGDLQTSERFL